VTSFWCHIFVCKSWVLLLKGDINFDEMLKHINWPVWQLNPQNMLIRHAVFHFELFLWLSYCSSVRSSTLLMLAGVRAQRHCVHDHLPAIIQMAWYCPTCQFFYLKVSFHQYSIVCLLSRNILHKLAAPCLLLTHKHLSVSVFKDKTHNLETRNYDIIESKEYLTFTLMEY